MYSPCRMPKLVVKAFLGKEKPFQTLKQSGVTTLFSVQNLVLMQAGGNDINK